ncbi:EamA-like transporter family protein [Amycolatopsis lurida]|uniref:Multidrug DMT transporter permease n=1 Tax=Amycolatopsis lurida NRRL 2430 TaxID=1460371 RepID=A0A2P2FND0_AMYLU|nr:EamA family transporter [Amycolatopsis lurida]KFU78206.1 multidrug DMT transporter permease [Amycolatopsis lurida NRRL 2430]SEC92389.1 EamA-like transporter family protein [Amycolatopsis lurida]
MNATALSFVVIAAVIHAGWNLAAKRIRRGGARFVWAYYSLSAILLVPVMAVSLAVEPQRPQWTWLFAAVVTAVFHVTYGVVLQRGYAVGDLSVVYPVARGTGPLISVLAAVVLLGERPGVLGLLGAFLVVAGVLVIGTGRAPAHADAADRVARRKGLVYGLLTGLTIAAYTLWDAHSVTDLGVPPIVYFGTGAIVQSLLMTPYALKDRDEVSWLWREHKREVLVVGALSPVAYLLVLYALQIAPVSLVAPARELSIVLGGLAAWLVLGEANAVRRLAGSLVVLAGITAIAMA